MDPREGEMPVNTGYDSLPQAPSLDEHHRAGSRKLNKIGYFTNSCGEPFKNQHARRQSAARLTANSRPVVWHYFLL